MKQLLRCMLSPEVAPQRREKELWWSPLKPMGWSTKTQVTSHCERNRLLKTWRLPLPNPTDPTSSTAWTTQRSLITTPRCNIRSWASETCLSRATTSSISAKRSSQVTFTTSVSASPARLHRALESLRSFTTAHTKDSWEQSRSTKNDENRANRRRCYEKLRVALSIPKSMILLQWGHLISSTTIWWSSSLRNSTRSGSNNTRKSWKRKKKSEIGATSQILLAWTSHCHTVSASREWWGDSHLDQWRSSSNHRRCINSALKSGKSCSR